MARAREDVFDPIEILRALDRRRVAYIVVGALGRVIQGSDEITEGIDIVPSTKEENLRKLGHALEDLNARRVDGKPLALEGGLAEDPMLELETDAGELKVVPEPAGTRRLRSTSAGTRAESRSARAFAPRSRLSATQRGCSPHSVASRTSIGFAPFAV